MAIQPLGEQRPTLGFVQPLLGREANRSPLEAPDMGGETGPRTSRRLPPPANHPGRLLATRAQTRHSTVERHQLQLLRSQLGADQLLAQELRSRPSRAASLRTDV